MASDVNKIDRAGGTEKYIDISAKTARNSMSDMIGTNDEMIKAFNIRRAAQNVARAAQNKSQLPMYDASASTNQAAQGDFDEFVRETEQNKAGIKNAVPQAMSVLGDAGTALVAGAVLDKFTGGHIGKGAKKL